MQFFRRWYIQDELFCYRPANVILSHLSTWGFVNFDGSPLPQIYDNPFSNQHPPFRWRYNTNTSVYFDYVVVGGGNIYDSESLRIRSGNDARNISWPCDYNNYRSIIFIPLKNRGFLLSTGKEFGQGTYHHQAPSLYGFYEGLENSNNNCPLGGFMFYNNIANSFDFVYFYNSTNSDRIFDNTFVGMQTNNLWNWGSLLYDAHKGPHTEITTNHNIQQNVCTLIKYPYQNGFLSNLFLIYTSPCNDKVFGDVYSTGLWNKFFSFGGRNFYCPMGNLAVELPSN